MKTLEQITELVEMASTMIEPVRIQLNNAEWKLLAEHMARLRDLASCCYAGLGAEHNLPENWLDALHAAAEGKPFETEGLLPYRAAKPEFDLDDFKPGAIQIVNTKELQRLELMKHTPITLADVASVSGRALFDLNSEQIKVVQELWASLARNLADAMIEEASK